MNPLILLGGAGLGLLLLTSSSKASTSTSAAAKPLPKPGAARAIDFQARIGDALGRGDADGLMAIANDMQAAGLTAEAEALRTSAINLKQIGALGGAGGKSSPGQPTLSPSAALPNPPLVVLAPVISPSSTPLPAGVRVSPP